MNLESTKFDEITFCQAVERLKAGETVFADNAFEYKLEGGSVLSRDSRALLRFSATCLMFSNAITSKWFIKKPFDVRQAMRDKPDEWVGAFFDEDSESWRKVGFDFKNFKAVEVCIKDDVVTDFYKYGVSGALREELDACIPLDEVPADAR